MRTKQTIHGEPVKIIDYAYMSTLKNIFAHFEEDTPRCRGFGLNGDGCKEPALKIGDYVVSKIKRGRMITKPRFTSPPIWHVACFEKLYQ